MPKKGYKQTKKHKRKIKEGVKKHLPKSIFKKGHKQGHHFPKGHIPWNKNKKGVMPIPWNKNTKGLCKPNSGSFKKGQRGNKAGHWKNGKIKDNQGYVHIFQPFHPFATKTGYVRRSHLVMEKKIGRFLKPEEIVHHINGIRNDDRPENLKLFKNASAHHRFHYPKGSLLGKNK